MVSASRSADTGQVRPPPAGRFGAVGVYAALIRAALAGQMAYRRSFAFELVAQALLLFVDLAEIYAVFHQVGAIDGFSVAEVLVMYGLAAAAFALAQLAVGHVDWLSERVRAGTFDVLLVRPMSALGQLITSEVQLRRLGRLAASLVVLAIALDRAGVAWTPARIALLAITPVAGAVVFAALFIGASAVSFWVTEGGDVFNAFTYGSYYLSQWPASIFGYVVGRFFTFVLPAAFTAYLPTLAILGRTDPSGLPGWLTWSGPLAAAWAALLAGLLWRNGVRHYVGAGG